jgi:hypothetical protein
MTQKSKAIIIIVVAVLLFVLLILAVFDLFPGGNKKSDQGVVETEVILPDKNEDLPEGKVFDASNADEFADLNPANSDTTKTELESEAQDLVQFFIERISTYSSDAGFVYITDLYGFMTSGMRDMMDEYQNNAPDRKDYYSVVSEVEQISPESFSLEDRSAVYNVVLKRNEKSGESAEVYKQEAEVYLKQDNSGQWKVDNIVWGKKI